LKFFDQWNKLPENFRQAIAGNHDFYCNKIKLQASPEKQTEHCHLLHHVNSVANLVQETTYYRFK